MMLVRSSHRRSTVGRQLAILGGEPAFKEPVHVGRPNVPDPEGFLNSISDILERRWFTNQGPVVRKFEDRLTAFLGVKHVIAICNGTIALELAERALELSGEVIVPSFTFVATAHSLQWQGIRPVFCDIDPHSHCLDPAKVEQQITERTTAILAVHLWGRPCQVEELEEIASRRGLHLLFDAAHGFGCTYRGRMIGNSGDAEIFSFHATKFFNTFEGGAIATNDDELAQRLRLMKNFGFSGMDRVDHVGTNGKMSEVSAAMGLAGLDSLADFVSSNRINYMAYRRHLAELNGITMLQYDESERCNYQYIVIEVDERDAGLTRDQLLAALRAENVLARRYFWPGCHCMEPYRTLYPEAARALPVTEHVASRVIVLPTGSAVGVEDVEIICGIIRRALEHPGAVAEAVGDAPYGV